jgi:hypothetical protein
MKSTIDIKSEADLTKEVLFDLFSYFDGVLFWKRPSSNRIKIGSLAGSKEGCGYIQVRIAGKRYKAHRLIFKMHNDFYPKEIDHINGIRDDNRIENLRQATRIQNARNVKTATNNSSGVKNVTWHKRLKKWSVSISVNNKSKHVCYTNDLDVAKLEAIKARKQYFGDFAKTNNKG